MERSEVTGIDLNIDHIGIVGTLLLIGAAIYVARKGIRLDVRNHDDDDK